MYKKERLNDIEFGEAVDFVVMYDELRSKTEVKSKAVSTRVFSFVNVASTPTEILTFVHAKLREFMTSDGGRRIHCKMAGVKITKRGQNEFTFIT